VTRLWRNADASKLALRFPGIREVDAGDYTCFAENSLFRASLTFHVTVLMREAEPAGDDWKSEDSSPCDYEVDEEQCLDFLCKAHPRLPLCRHKGTGTDASSIHSVTADTTTESTLPVWVTVVGILLLLLVLAVLLMFTWKYYTSTTKMHVPFGAVRFGQEDEVDMLDRSQGRA